MASKVQERRREFRGRLDGRVEGETELGQMFVPITMVCTDKHLNQRFESSIRPLHWITLGRVRGRCYVFYLILRTNAIQRIIIEFRAIVG